MIDSHNPTMNFLTHRGTFLTAVLMVLAINSGAQAAAPPNVVFILVDDLGYMDIGANNPKTFLKHPTSIV